jgi:hypothetical protein
MANHLAPHLDKLVSPSQSAFIKGRSIHDNFRYIQGAVKHFHCSKTPMLLLKLDIEKAFDSVTWEYILELMVQLGFGQRWRDVIALLWKTTSSRILFNGVAGRPIYHRRSRAPSRRPTLAVVVYFGYWPVATDPRLGHTVHSMVCWHPLEQTRWKSEQAYTPPPPPFLSGQ